MKKFLFLLFLMPAIVFSQTNFDKAEKLFAQEKFSEAKPIFEAILKESPNNIKTIEYLGDIGIHLKDWDSAINYYQTLKNLKPKEANYYYRYGGILGLKSKEEGKWVAIQLIGDMRKSFEKALLLNPNHLEARWALIEYYLQVPGLFGGSEKKAQRYANELMTLSPVDGYLSRGYIDEYFKRFSKAELNYKKAHAIGNSKTTFQKLYNLYLTKIKDKTKANKLKTEFNK